MKKILCGLVLISLLYSCSRENLITETHSRESSATVGNRGALPNENSFFAAYNTNMTFSTSLACYENLAPLQIVIDPALPLITKPAVVFGVEPFLTYVRHDYTILNIAIADIIYGLTTTPKVAQYSYSSNEYNDYVYTYSNPEKPLKFVEVSFGQDESNAIAYGTIFPWDKFMNQDIVNTMSHNIINQIKTIVENNGDSFSSINLNAIAIYKDSTLCEVPYHSLKVKIAYTMR